MDVVVGQQADMGASPISAESILRRSGGGVVVGEESVYEGPATGGGFEIFANEEAPCGEASRDRALVELGQRELPARLNSPAAPSSAPSGAGHRQAHIGAR